MHNVSLHFDSLHALRDEVGEPDPEHQRAIL